MVRTGNFWSGPLFSGSNHWRGTFQKTVVRTTVPGSNRRAWFIPEILVSTSSRLVFNRGLTAALRFGARYRIHTLNRTHRTVSDARRQPDTGDTRALASPLHVARQRGSRQGSHARAPAHQSDRSTWRGSEEACELHACECELHASLPKAPLGLGPPQSESMGAPLGYRGK
jgi:hypothetical protein